MAKSVSDSSRKNIETIVTFQDKIVQQLKQRVAELSSEITAKTQTTQLAISNLKSQTQTAEIEAQELKDDIEENKANNILLFISAYRSKKKEKAISNKIQQVLEEQKQIPTIELEMNKFNESALDNCSWIATYREIKDTSGTENLEIGSVSKGERVKQLPSYPDKSCNSIGLTKPPLDWVVENKMSHASYESFDDVDDVYYWEDIKSAGTKMETSNYRSTRDTSATKKNHSSYGTKEKFESTGISVLKDATVNQYQYNTDLPSEEIHKTKPGKDKGVKSDRRKGQRY